MGRKKIEIQKGFMQRFSGAQCGWGSNTTAVANSKTAVLQRGRKLPMVKGNRNGNGLMW